jgi:hypothetical protein
VGGSKRFGTKQHTRAPADVRDVVAAVAAEPPRDLGEVDVGRQLDALLILSEDAEEQGQGEWFWQSKK